MGPLSVRQQSTQARILEAAAEAFSSKGLDGATTREIARLAGVNEVTIFRHFQSKEKLLAAVVNKALPQEAPSDPARHRGMSVTEVFRAHARIQHKLLAENMTLLRAFIGEIHRYSEHERGVFKALFLQNRIELIRDLQERKEAGEILAEVNLEIVADQFTGTLLSDLLRRTSKTVKRDYSLEVLLEATVSLFVRGLEVRK